ncbi:MAG: DnaJ domain-containing protein [Tepidisphaerales bacterium]
MAARQMQQDDWDQAMRLLGVSAEAGEAEIRAAYMENVRRHPPDREPELFEQLRDAYELLKDPRTRARRVLAGPDPTAPLASMLDDIAAPRKFVGTALWMEVLKEKRP